MNVNELRIGNWVYDQYNRICVVKEIFNGKVTYEYLYELKPDGSRNYAVITCNQNLIKPIPLTDEILLKAGFTTHPEDKCLYFKEQFRYDSLTCNITLLRYCAREGESQQHSCGYPFLTDKISIQYLHQLQNLYFALTGEELQINI